MERISLFAALHKDDHLQNLNLFSNDSVSVVVCVNQSAPELCDNCLSEQQQQQQQQQQHQQQDWHDCLLSFSFSLWWLLLLLLLLFLRVSVVLIMSFLSFSFTVWFEPWSSIQESPLLFNLLFVHELFHLVCSFRWARVL